MNKPRPTTVRIAMLISGGGRTLLNILAEIDSGRLDATIAVVIASRACKGVDRARAAGLDVRIVPYRQMPDNDTYSAGITGILDEVGVDLVCMAGFLSFWRIPDRYAGKVMNIHPALLPCFAGKGFYGSRVHRAVLQAGLKVTGCSVHFVNNEYDAGPIIIQRPVPVAEDDTAETLAARVFQQECIAYPEAIRLFAAGRLRIDGRVVHIAEPRQ